MDWARMLAYITGTVDQVYTPVKTRGYLPLFYSL